VHGSKARETCSLEAPKASKIPTYFPGRLSYTWTLHREADVMSELTFQQKQDYYDKVRRSNYLASLRLEGFDTTRADAEKPLPTRESVLKKYRQNPR
jgi:hypothetical protein